MRQGRGSCAAENPNRTVLTLQAIRKGDPSLPACKGCGCKGGPGYRKPNGRCSGWDELAAACGDPPTTRCRAEIVQPNADAAAQAQAEYGRLTSACR